MLPVPTHPKIGTPYGAKGKSWSGGMHRGVDFPAPKGTPVYAPWGGKVIGIGSWGPAYGSTAPVIDFDKLPDGSPGLWGVIAHLDTVAVKAGERVHAGQFIGTVGARGNATGPHVHFEIQTAARWRPPTAGNVSRNPAPWLSALPLLTQGRVMETQMRANIANSDSVRNLQIALRQAGAFGGKVGFTGNYGAMTRAAVEIFQRRKGLPRSGGIAGAEEVTALGLSWVPAVKKPAPAPKPTTKPKPKPTPKPAPAVSDRGAFLLRALSGFEDRAIFEPFWDDVKIAGNGSFAPRFVVLHHTGGTNSLTWLSPGGADPRVPGANILVRRDGKFHVLSCRKTYHAGEGRGFGVPLDSMNDWSFGIEVESLGKEQDFTPEQIDTVTLLNRGLIREMGRTPEAVINHASWSRTGKPDTLYPEAFWREKMRATTPAPPSEQEQLRKALRALLAAEPELVLPAIRKYVPEVK